MFGVVCLSFNYLKVEQCHSVRSLIPMICSWYKICGHIATVCPCAFPQTHKWRGYHGLSSGTSSVLGRALHTKTTSTKQLLVNAFYSICFSVTNTGNETVTHVFEAHPVLAWVFMLSKITSLVPSLFMFVKRLNMRLPINHPFVSAHPQCKLQAPVSVSWEMLIIHVKLKYIW